MATAPRKLGRRSRRFATLTPNAGMGGDVDTVVGLCLLLADTTRLNILLLLGGAERPVNGLRDALGIKQPVVSSHLASLRRSALVACRRDGKNVVYRLLGRVEIRNDGAFRVSLDGWDFEIRRGLCKASVGSVSS